MAKVLGYTIFILSVLFIGNSGLYIDSLTGAQTTLIITLPQRAKIAVDTVVVAPKAKPLTLRQIYTSQIGVREKTGKNDGKEVEMYLKSVGLGKGYAWCSAFVHWCLDSAKIRNTVTAWSPSAVNVNNYVYRAQRFDKEPISGDVFTLYYTSLGRIGHTGFFDERINGKTFYSVEGNTNDALSREGDGVYKKIRSFNAIYNISRWAR